MDRRIMIWIAIGILFLVVLFFAFKVGVGTEGANLAASASSSVQASGGMVGGC